MADAVHIASLDQITERVIHHLRQGHDTTLVGSPGCGITTFVAKLSANIVDNEFGVVPFDLQAKSVTEFTRELAATPPASNGERQVLVLDHAGRFLGATYSRLIALVEENTTAHGRLCLWCGALDARATDRELGLKLCSVPSAHVSFPMMTRDELLAVYRTIARNRACNWGEAIQYLMLDLCGNDLALVESATDYLHGDWTNQLYDESVWDRIHEWLREDATVDAYRIRLGALPRNSEAALALFRFGGKPQRPRPELIEEADDGLRKLCLDGFIVANLLPGYYQLRNLVVRFLLDESIEPRTLFRRTSNARVAVLLQDIETTLRQVLASVFDRIGDDVVREKLRRMTRPGEVIDGELNKSLLKWARRNCVPDALTELTDLLQHHRVEFKMANSAWAKATQLMEQDNLGGYIAKCPRITRAGNRGSRLSAGRRSIVIVLDDVHGGQDGARQFLGRGVDTDVFLKFSLRRLVARRLDADGAPGWAGPAGRFRGLRTGHAVRIPSRYRSCAAARRNRAVARWPTIPVVALSR